MLSGQWITLPMVMLLCSNRVAGGLVAAGYQKPRTEHIAPLVFMAGCWLEVPAILALNDLSG